MSRVVHFEIHASEPESLVAFYRELFGWKIEKWSGPLEYWLIETGDAGKPGINGGVFRRMGEAQRGTVPVNAWVCTVDVESLDAKIARIAKLKAEIVVPKKAIPGVGWLAYAKDPDGNIFGMMQADAKAA